MSMAIAQEKILDLEPMIRLTKDLKAAALTLRSKEVRYLVDLYYQFQDYRCQADNQVRSLVETGEPNLLVSWLSEQQYGLENRIKAALNIWTNNQPLGVWAQSICGIGPVITAGLMVHIDITKTLTAGKIWSFAGLDPTSEWKAGQKRPWNAKLKTLCWKIGESFVKVKGRPNDIYGKIYEIRKQFEAEKNDRREYADQAADILKKMNIGKSTTAYQYYKQGMLPPGHIHARAKRYAVKLFLSHYHYVAYKLHFGTEPPKPYVIEHLGHANWIAAPNLEIVGL